MSQGSGLSVYLLVHPELWPSNDVAVTHDLLADLTCAQVDRAYGEAVAAQSSRAQLRVVVDDGTVADAISDFGEGELAGVVDLASWELLPASARDVDRVVAAWARDLPPGSTVTVAGFNRFDCVARVVSALQALPVLVRVDDEGTLPCSDASARSLRSRALGTSRSVRVTGGPGGRSAPDRTA